MSELYTVTAEEGRLRFLPRTDAALEQAVLIGKFHTGIEPVACADVAERVVPRLFRLRPAGILCAAHCARAVAVLMSRSRDDLAVRDLRAAVPSESFPIRSTPASEYP